MTFPSGWTASTALTTTPRGSPGLPGGPTCQSTPDSRSSPASAPPSARRGDQRIGRQDPAPHASRHGAGLAVRVRRRTPSQNPVQSGSGTAWSVALRSRCSRSSRAASSRHPAHPRRWPATARDNLSERAPSRCGATRRLIQRHVKNAIRCSTLTPVRRAEAPGYSGRRSRCGAGGCGTGSRSRRRG